jgi:leucyl aminopeptidase
MLSIQITDKKFWDNGVEGYIFLIKENMDSASDRDSLSYLEQNHYPHLQDILKKHQFNGKRGQSFVLTGMKDGALAQFIFVGLGQLNGSWHHELENLRRAFATATQLLKKLSIQSAVVGLPDAAPFKISSQELTKQLAITAHMALYEFAQFKSDKKEVSFKGTLLIDVATQDLAACSNMLAQGNLIGQAINQARGWADLPANLMTPTSLSLEAQKVADEFKLACTIFGHEKARELGMGAFLSVDAGSEQDGKFVILEYKCQDKNAPTIALCGKGVTFDTGGISLKPSNSMCGMKFDMSGAAAVIATMKIIAQLKPAINVIGLTPLVENMPSGRASRQDDIVVAMNGKSIEIKNTDAEGRLILADTLCYAEKFYNPDVIIDIATLTGACLHALGHFYTGVMTRDEELGNELRSIGQLTGDRMWPLPLHDDFKEANRSETADINNSGSSAYLAGTIIGACFLEAFVDKARWAHLDIAGTAHDVPGINYVGKGSTGAGIRALVEFVMSYKS